MCPIISCSGAYGWPRISTLPIVRLFDHFWYRLSQVVLERRPYDGCCCCCCLIEKNIHHNMSSFNESVALGCLKQAAIELVKYAFSFILFPIFVHWYAFNTMRSVKRATAWVDGVKTEKCFFSVCALQIELLIYSLIHWFTAVWILANKIG